MNPFITIFTATYNRGYILPQLYESLCDQTDKSFEWLIIDDGSIDDTEKKVSSWIAYNNDFSIRYYKKENAGKPRAINDGVAKANGKYFFIVDSDDYLSPNAIEKMMKWISEIDSDPSFIGVGAARGYKDNSYIKGVEPIVNKNGYVDATNLDRYLYHLDADMCEAYKIDIFKQFPMAEWPEENFAPEQIALNEIALAGYKVRWHKDIIYYCEYLEDGLTKGSNLLVKNNPMGYAMMYNHMLKYRISFVKKFHAACQHIALSIYAGNPKYILESNYKGVTIFALPMGCLLALRRAKQFQKM